MKELQDGRSIFVLGASDTGKTTFIRFLINEFIKAQKRVAFVDGDIGQSTIGIPTTISSALISSAQDLKSPKLNSLFFVGSTSPPGNLLQTAVGLKKTVDAALELEPDLTIIDTTGFINGPAAYELKYQKISLVQPTHIAAIQKGKELEPLLRVISQSFENSRIIRLKPVPAVKPRSLDERQLNRERKFGDYFSDAKKLQLKPSQVSLRRGPFGIGIPVSELKLYELSKSSGLELLYGEEGSDEAVFIARSMGHGTSQLGRVQNYIKKNWVRVVNRSELEGVIVALENGKGFIISLGVVTGIEEAGIEVLTPLRDPSKVRLITFGSLKLEPSGREVGKVTFY